MVPTGKPAISPDDPHFCSDFADHLDALPLQCEEPAHDFDDDDDEVEWESDDRHRRLR